MKHKLFTLFVLLALLIAFLPAQPARADSIITVNSTADTSATDGSCTLREAINNANSDSDTTSGDCTAVGADTILFNGSLGTATIVLGSMLSGITDADGLTIDGDQRITLSGNESVRVFHVGAGALLSLQAISVADGSADSGGGMENYGTVTISYSTFSNNSATFNGGGVYVDGSGTLTITHSTFSNNSATNGGGLYNRGVANVAYSAFTNNSATTGGGAANVLSTLTITHSTFSNNTATGEGGGLGSSGTLTITNSTFSGNNAAWGGGVQNNGGTATILNSTFSGNSATNDGGGVETYKSGATPPTTTIRNTILANSTSGNDCLNHATGTLIGGNNIIETTSTCNSIATLTSDPDLGSPTRFPAYFPLNAGSPAIDAGDDAICAAAPVNKKSQNGRTRPQGLHCDIGSYEADVTLTVRSNGVNDGWVLESGENTTAGGTKDSTATTFFLGDGAQDKQYRAILHFNTADLPDDAVITKVTLKIKKQGLSGTNPFTILDGLKVDMRKPYFGAAAGLVIGDFQAAAGKSSVATFNATPTSNWYRAILNATGRAYVNKTGTTQFRLRFATDDNNDMAADYMKFYSGDAGTASTRPTLIVEYYVP